MESVMNSMNFLAHLSPSPTLAMSIASNPTRWYTRSTVAYDLPYNVHVNSPFQKEDRYITLKESTNIISSGTTGLTTWEVCVFPSEHTYTTIQVSPSGDIIVLHVCDSCRCVCRLHTTLWNGQQKTHRTSVRSEGFTALHTACFFISPLHARHILELGCGLGLVGLALCSSCDPLSYCFTDCHPQVLTLLRDNIDINLIGTDIT